MRESLKSFKDRFKNFDRIGLEPDHFADIYHRVLVMSWLQFVAIYFALFLLFNILFGVLYWLINGVSGTDGSLFQSFAFSVQTFSTVGYGVFSPNSVYSHSLVILESMLSVIMTALLTGLAFAKFARPTARIRFTEKVVIMDFNGQKALIFRLANLRGNQIAEATIRAMVLMPELTKEGMVMRVQKEVKFLRNTSSFFILTWTVVHIIDQESPLFGLNAQDILEKNIEMSVSVFGYDETFSQNVHASGIYLSDEFIFNKKFADVIVTKNNIATALDLTKFNTIIDE